ncbi:MAG: twin-arginine translocase subunit TatC [Actinomycetota bacterium]
MSEAGNLRRRRLALRRRKRPRSTAMSMMEHLSELRTRLIASLVGFGVVSIAAFLAFEPITDLLLRPLCDLPSHLLGPNGCELVFTSATEPISVRLKVTAMAGVVCSSPLWLYQLWAFIVPGLTPKEKRYALPFVLSSVTLFALGTVFAYITLPNALEFLVGFGGDNLTPLFTAKEYLSFVSMIIIIFGVVFELPLLLYFLGLAEIVSLEALRKARRMAIVGITMLSALVTPSQDPYTMLAMSVPLYALYELVIALLGIREKRRRSKA